MTPSTTWNKSNLPDNNSQMPNRIKKVVRTGSINIWKIFFVWGYTGVSVRGGGWWESLLLFFSSWSANIQFPLIYQNGTQEIQKQVICNMNDDLSKRNPVDSEICLRRNAESTYFTNSQTSSHALSISILLILRTRWYRLWLS